MAHIETSKVTYLCLLLSLLIIATSFHLAQAECVNSTTSCNVNAKLVTTQNNCSECVCLDGFYHHGGLASCERCNVCEFPFVIIENCTQTTNTECGLCQKTHFHTEKGCKMCKTCENGIIKKCGRKYDAVCSLKTNATSTKGSHEDNNTFTPGSHEHNNKTVVNECKRNDYNIWFTLFVMQSAVIVITLILLCVLCRRCSRNHYTNVIDESSLTASSSFSSLMLNTKWKSQANEISLLTTKERESLVRALPGGYAESLAMLLNPNVSPNWVQLAYQFGYTLQQVAVIRGKTCDFTQELLLELGTKNENTVERLWRALKAIKRDDASTTLVKFMLSLREDNQSAIVFLE